MTKIRQRRLDLAWTQAQLAKKLNIHPANASRLETGSTKAGPRLMSKVASTLEQTAEELFDGDGWPLVE